MAKINEYPQAATINNNDLFVIDQQSGGDHSTKSASVSQITDKVTAQIGDLNGNISDSYDPTTAYVKGDLCIYENALYICTAPTTGTFDPSKWTATTIDNVIGPLSSLTTTNKDSLVDAVNEVNAKESYKVRVSQLQLPNTITLTANTATVVLSNSDVKSLTYSALDDISNMTGTLVGVMFMWCSGGGAICLDNLVWEGKCTMYLMSTYTKDISAIRLMTIWKQ